MHERRNGEIREEERDKVKLEISKIRKDPWVKQAVKISKKHDLLGRMGIEKVEYSFIFNLYLAIRLLRTKIHDEHWELSQETRNRDKLEQSARGLKNIYCASIEDHNKVRTMELAANALIATAAVFDESRQKTEIVFNPRSLSNWGTRWSNEIRQRNTA